ncbi:hypothetical protein AALO_G00213410 [Alosa alosa]|uniref:Uncharacterized protein n=1 Tax=Alosa alosa TaxID=278164 RepID=A0AAV6G091_9TELE|nr:hypothetical protein AALO_G00213410 [Alosa alosa]
MSGARRSEIHLAIARLVSFTLKLRASVHGFSTDEAAFWVPASRCCTCSTAPSGLLLSESSGPGLCPEISDWEMEDEAQNIEKDDQCAQDTALTVTSNDSKDDQNQAALP